MRLADKISGKKGEFRIKRRGRPVRESDVPPDVVYWKGGARFRGLDREQTAEMMARQYLWKNEPELHDAAKYVKAHQRGSRAYSRIPSEKQLALAAEYNKRFTELKAKFMEV